MIFQNIPREKSSILDLNLTHRDRKMQIKMIIKSAIAQIASNHSSPAHYVINQDKHSYNQMAEIRQAYL